MKLTDIGFFWNSIGYWIRTLYGFLGYCLIDYVSINFNSKVTYAHINNNRPFA
jgi:hypothetical protein